MSTKGIRKKLRMLGKSDAGPRNVLNKRLKECSQDEDKNEELEEETRGHASDSPLSVMVDENSGNKYARSVDHKGLGEEGDNSWLIKDMHQELKAWGYPGEGQNALILKSDGEPALVAVREALACLLYTSPSPRDS